MVIFTLRNLCSIRTYFRGGARRFRAYTRGIVLLLATLLVASGLSSSAQQFYDTQPGDNLFRIALRYGTTIEALAQANGIPPPYTIHAGTRIKLAAPSASAQRIHIVQSGETLYGISLLYDTTPEALAAASGIQPPYIIHEGNWLSVPAPMCPKDEGMGPAEPVEPADPADPNLCNSEWTDCGDGSSPESDCRWKVGWCVANRGLGEEECQCLLCGVCVTPEPDPEPDPDPPAARKGKPTPDPGPECVLKKTYNEAGEEQTSTIATLCFKECLLGLPPLAICETL